MTQREVFRAALKKIKTHGWAQGVYGDRRHGYCILGAVSAASPAMHKTNRALWERLCEKMDKSVRGNVVLWNDQKRRKKEDVLKLLRKLAK